MTRFRAVPLVLSVLCATAGFAQSQKPAGQPMVRDRPDPAGTPTEVSLGIYLFDIDQIDDVRQRFSVDLMVSAQWRDARLALPEDQRSGRFRTLPLDEIWDPRGLIVNDRGLSPQLPRTADVDDSGNVEYIQRLSGELAADLQYEEFPFDKQRLPIDIVSYQYSPDELVFSLDAAISGDDGSFSEEGWRIRILEPEFGVFSIPAEDVVRPRLTYYVEATRNTRYYLWTMFLPMSLIVFMSWTAFWLQPSLVPPRVAISTASVFSLIAFGFSIRLSLPPVPYLTRADVFVVGCTMLVFLSLAVTVVGSRWAISEQMERALSLNAASRWAYAGLYFLVVAVALLR